MAFRGTDDAACAGCDDDSLQFNQRAALPELRQAHCDYLSRITGIEKVDARDGKISNKRLPTVVHKVTEKKKKRRRPFVI